MVHEVHKEAEVERILRTKSVASAGQMAREVREELGRRGSRSRAGSRPGRTVITKGARDLKPEGGREHEVRGLRRGLEAEAEVWRIREHEVRGPRGGL